MDGWMNGEVNKSREVSNVADAMKREPRDERDPASALVANPPIPDALLMDQFSRTSPHVPGPLVHTSVHSFIHRIRVTAIAVTSNAST